MDVDWFYRTILLIVLLLFSALFSGSEVALFSLDDKKLDEINKRSKHLGKYITKLIAFPKKLLITILIGNTISNVALSIIAVSISLDIAKIYNYPVDIVLLIQIIILTIIVILFSEITPKVWANKYPVKASKLIAIPLHFLSIIISPISKLLSLLMKVLTSNVKYDKSRTALSTSDIADLADIGIEKGTLEEEEHELIHGLVSFKTLLAREVMTPRVDIISVPENIPFSELIEIIKTSGHSRIPVYSNDLDSIIGVIHAKDLLPYLNNESLFNIKKVTRECLFVPETKLLSALMKEFQEKNMHISIVVDEYGGTAGLITLEDILEEIVGEIRDEYDTEEDEIMQISENKFIMFGKVYIDELEEKLKIDIEVPNEDFETLGGFIFNHAGTIPDIGYKFEKYGYSFKVIALENNRISKVEVEKLSQ
ncbi:MAG: HlyC/CorC family transporter [Ignavibacteriae bacterium]|nr:HlyC/CorC family transporter [Ignavibacteriota bacterium]